MYKFSILLIVLLIGAVFGQFKLNGGIGVQNAYKKHLGPSTGPQVISTSAGAQYTQGNLKTNANINAWKFENKFGVSGGNIGVEFNYKNEKKPTISATMNIQNNNGKPKVDGGEIKISIPFK